MASPALSPIAVPPRTSRAAMVFVGILSALAAGASTYLFLESGRSFDELRAVALGAIPPGYADRFTLDLYLKVTAGLRLFALLLAALAILLAILVKPLSAFFSRALAQTRTVLLWLWEKTLALRQDPLHLAALSFILLGSAALRVAFLREPIRNDEAYSFMYYASRPLYIALTYYTVNNHLLNTLFMHLSTALFGASLWALRLPTLFAGILLIPVTYAVTRLSHGKNAALLAAALVAGSSPLIEYSFNARGYSLGALLFLLMLLAVGLVEKGFAGAWYFLPLTASFAMYSVPTMVYGVGGLFLYTLLRRLDWNRTLLAILSTALLTLLLYSPVLFTVGASSITNNRWVVPVPGNLWAVECRHELASLWAYWNSDLPRLLAVFLVAAIAGLLLKPRDLLRVPVAPLLCVVATAAVLLPIQHLVPFRRTWLFLLPLSFASAAVGFQLFLRRFARSNLLAALLAPAILLWMGGSVLTGKSLRRSGIEAAGGRDSAAIVLAMKQRLLAGDQFICTNSFDAPLDFEMYHYRIPYRPSPDGDLLIVTPGGQSPSVTLAVAGIRPTDLLSLRLLNQFGSQDVYVAVRGPHLPFQPGGSTWMGEFKSTS